MVHYAASKSAALALHEGLSSELKHIYKAPKVRTTVVCPSVVGTKMFEGLEGGNSFMMPVLRPEEVAEAITSSLRSTYSNHVEMPLMGKWLTPWTRALPSWYRYVLLLHHLARSRSLIVKTFRVTFQDAAKDSMTTFSGHKVLD